MKILLLNSGGKDSLATAMLLAAEGHELHSLYVDVGQPTAAAENAVAAKIAAKYGASHATFQAGPARYVTKSATGLTLPPYKAAIMHLAGAMHAVMIGAEALASGQRADALHEDFPARIRAFLGMSRQNWKPLPLIFPLHGPRFHVEGRDPGFESKLVYKFIQSDPLWRETIYCLEDPPCGKCPRCWSRESELVLAGEGL